MDLVSFVFFQTTVSHVLSHTLLSTRLRFGNKQHPHFDFSGAEFNGNVPVAKDFMGGVKYS
jgi:hypothetical protein